MSVLPLTFRQARGTLGRERGGANRRGNSVRPLWPRRREPSRVRKHRRGEALVDARYGSRTIPP